MYLILHLTYKGASNDIVDARLFQQFFEYLENKKNDTNSFGSRKKRSINDDDLISFLNDVYPGAQQIPTQMVRMLASPEISPDNKIESTALFHKRANNRCQADVSQCPESFFQLEEDGKCIFDPKQEMTMEDAYSYMPTIDNGNAKLFQFESLEKTKMLFEYVKSGQ